MTFVSVLTSLLLPDILLRYPTSKSVPTVSLSRFLSLPFFMDVYKRMIQITLVTVRRTSYLRLRILMHNNLIYSHFFHSAAVNVLSRMCVLIKEAGS